MLSPDGSVSERISTLGALPTNIAFAPADGYLTFVRERFERGAPWVRILAEAVWADRSDAEVAEWFRYESLVNLALVEKAAGRSAEARDLLQRAVAIDPRHPGSQYNLAVVADDSGDTAAAITHYREFLRFGTVAHPDLAALVRTRLAVLGSL